MIDAVLRIIKGTIKTNENIEKDENAPIELLEYVGLGELAKQAKTKLYPTSNRKKEPDPWEFLIEKIHAIQGIKWEEKFNNKNDWIKHLQRIFKEIMKNQSHKSYFEEMRCRLHTHTQATNTNSYDEESKNLELNQSIYLLYIINNQIKDIQETFDPVDKQKPKSKMPAVLGISIGVVIMGTIGVMLYMNKQDTEAEKQIQLEHQVGLSDGLINQLVEACLQNEKKESINSG